MGNVVHIAINAHLLSKASGYRKAGIHRYIYGVLSQLPTLAPNLRFTYLLNHRLPDDLGTTTQRIGWDTSHPIKRILWEQLIQPWAMRQVNADVYHGMAFVAPYGLKMPSIVTVYDLSFERYPEVLSRFRRTYLSTFTKSSCQRATRVIAISESTANDLTELWGIDPAKIDVSSVGVSPEFKPLSSEEIQAFRAEKSLPTRFLLFLGTLEPRKNLPMLLRAYAQLKPAVRQELHLVLGGGKGWMYDEIFETIATHNLSDTVHLTGYIPSEDLVRWYNAADAFVYPTLYEGFGIPILEAMACGKPVLASNSSSLPEATGTIGKLLPPQDESAWTQAMQQVYEMGTVDAQNDAIAWAAQFTWQRVANNTIETYRQATT